MITTVKGISMATINTREVRIVAMNTGKPRKMKRIRTRNTSATLSMELPPIGMVPPVEEDQYVIEENESGTYRNSEVEKGDRQVHALDVGESIGPHPKAPMVDQQEHGKDDTDMGCLSEPGHPSGRKELLQKVVHAEMGTFLYPDTGSEEHNPDVEVPHDLVHPV
jgi:hypothetical protein